MTPNDKKNINASTLDPDLTHKKNIKNIIKTTKIPKMTGPDAKSLQMTTGKSDKKGKEAEVNIEKKNIDTQVLQRNPRDISNPFADNKKDKNTTLKVKTENKGISTTKIHILKKEDKFSGSEKQTLKKPKKCNKTSKNK
jgi:hypothetical protein